MLSYQVITHIVSIWVAAYTMGLEEKHQDFVFTMTPQLRLNIFEKTTTLKSFTLIRMPTMVTAYSVLFTMIQTYALFQFTKRAVIYFQGRAKCTKEDRTMDSDIPLIYQSTRLPKTNLFWKSIQRL